MTKLELYDYELPEELIAQYPCQERGGSRLLVVHRKSGKLKDRRFLDIVEYLKPGDLLVMNDSRVIPARLLGEKATTGAHIELLLLKDRSNAGEKTAVWEVLARPLKRLKAGDCVSFGCELSACVLEKSTDGSVLVRFEHAGTFLDVLEKVGKVPLPPYIRREPNEADSKRYQTVYAKAPGSAAAPTAGLHFTEELLELLRSRGVQTQFVTLHVGLGTFQPVQADEIEDHRMHEEFYHIDQEAADAITLAKSEGRRVICVGTTSVRTIESAAVTDSDGNVSVKAGWGNTNLYIYPGGRGFRLTDALVTNFHLPKSTLLMLVSTFYERKKMLEAYQHAIEKAYRFFSYGDAMLIL